MRFFLKQLISFILPFTVLILIPLDIENDISIHNVFALVGGIILILSGLYLMIVTISLFIRIGKGTLAPWSPTRNLVTSGIYSYTRNPMITGVLLILAGESLSILSYNIFMWTIIFFIINNIYFLIYEEPLLKHRFGDDYKVYKKNVPRWIPRLKPWRK